MSIIWEVYTPQIIDGHGLLNFLGGLHLQNNRRTWIRQPFWGSTPLKKLTDMDPLIIWGVYTPRIIDRHGSVNYLGGLHLQNN